MWGPTTAAGAIVGDNLGCWVGHEGSYRLLRRYGRVIRLDERKLKLGQYLFLKRGGKVIFFGRYVAMLRAWAACLAGTERMAWPRCLVFNAAGDILWPTLYGLGGYAFGNNVHRLKLWHAPPTSLIIDTGRGKTVVLVAAAVRGSQPEAQSRYRC